MTKPIIYNINKNMVFYTKDAFLFCFVCTILYFIQSEAILLWILVVLIVSFFHYLKAKKHPIGKILISSDSVEVKLYDKQYSIKNSDIYKLIYYRDILDTIYFGKIIYRDTEENSFTIGMEQADIKKIKKTIEEKMGVNIKTTTELSKKDLQIIKKEEKMGVK